MANILVIVSDEEELFNTGRAYADLVGKENITHLTGTICGSRSRNIKTRNGSRVFIKIVKRPMDLLGMDINAWSATRGLSMPEIRKLLAYVQPLGGKETSQDGPWEDDTSRALMSAGSEIARLREGMAEIAEAGCSSSTVRDCAAVMEEDLGSWCPECRILHLLGRRVTIRGSGGTEEG